MALCVVAGLTQELMVRRVVEPCIVGACDGNDVVHHGPHFDIPNLGTPAVARLGGAWQSRAAESSTWYVEVDELVPEPLDIGTPPGAVSACARGTAPVVIRALLGGSTMVRAGLRVGAAELGTRLNWRLWHGVSLLPFDR